MNIDLPLPTTISKSLELGVKYYFTGNECKNGHISPRLAKSRLCVQCSRDKCNNYSIKNKEKIRKYNKKYKEENKEKIREYNKKYKEENKETLKEKQKEYREENKDKIRGFNQAYHNERKKCPKFRAKKVRNATAWAKNNRGRVRIANRARRHTVSALGRVTSKMISNLLHLQSCRCANPKCLKKVNPRKRNSFHLDHINPISKGGTNDIYNLQILCPKCNMSKGNKQPYEWAEYNGFLI